MTNWTQWAAQVNNVGRWGGGCRAEMRGVCQSGPVFEIVRIVRLTDFVLSLYHHFFVFYLCIVVVLYLCISYLFLCINISQFVHRPSSSILKAWWAIWKLNYERKFALSWSTLHSPLYIHLSQTTSRKPPHRPTPRRQTNIKNKLPTHLPIHPIESHPHQKPRIPIDQTRRSLHTYPALQST